MYTNELTKEEFQYELNKQKELERIEKMIALHKQTMIAKNEGSMAVEIIGLNGIVERCDNGFTPLNNTTIKTNNHPSREDYNNMMMFKNNYDRLLREHRVDLLKYDLEYKKLIMLTVTSDTKLGIDYNMMNAHARNLDKRLKRNFKNIIMIKRFEHSERNRMLHIHYALFFDNKIPKELTEEWASKTWKYGTVNVSEFDKEGSLIGYITKYKFSDIDELDCTITKFPYGAHIIQKSKNIPEITDIKKIKASKEDLDYLKYLYNHRSLLKYNKPLYEYEQIQEFVDNDTGELHGFTSKRIYS